MSVPRVKKRKDYGLRGMDYGLRGMDYGGWIMEEGRSEEIRECGNGNIVRA